MYTAVARPCTRAVCTARNTAHSRPCTRPSTLIYVYMGRRYGIYTAVYVACPRLITAGRRVVYTAVQRPCTPVCVYTCRVYRYTAVCAPCTRPSAWPVQSSVHGPCARRYTAVYTFVYTACERPVHGHVTAVYSHVRVHIRVHGAYTAVYMPCTRPKTAVYTARTRPVHGRVHGRLHLYTCTWAVETAFTRPCTYHVHGHVHGRITAVYTCTRVHLPCIPLAVCVPCTRPTA